MNLKPNFLIFLIAELFFIICFFTFGIKLNIFNLEYHFTDYLFLSFGILIGSIIFFAEDFLKNLFCLGLVNSPFFRKIKITAKEL